MCISIQKIIQGLVPVVIMSALCACSNAERTTRRADAAMTIGEYQEAASLYRRAYMQTAPRERASRGALAYKMGEAYRSFGNVGRALAAYKNAERFGVADSLVLRKQGDMLRYAGNYKGAEEKYKAYLEKNPEDVLALAGYRSSQKATAIREAGSAYTVKLDKNFSSSRADYCPAFSDRNGSAVYFSSTRNSGTGGQMSGITGTKPGDIYCLKKDEKGHWKSPEAAEGELNSEWDEGAACFTEDGNTMYFTVCRSDPQYPRMAEIWTSTRNDAKWGKPQALKITADTLSSYAHPALSPDGKWLYFVSDMPGGYGGYDLWRASVVGGHGVGAVENLGPEINTPGNEMFPAFRPSGELYFSSDGREPNLGGFDLYRAKEDTLTKHWEVLHLPYPMNSNGDDFGITFEGLHNRGFFSSNRASAGRGWDKIYSFSFPEILLSVKGWVYEQDGYELPEAVVYMVGNDGTNMKIGVNLEGSFEQPLAPGGKYLFLATCKGYLNYRAELTVDSLAQKEHQYVLQFPLPSISIPVLVRGVYYEFDKADLTDNSREALDRLVKVLKENPNITIELSAHCDYRGRAEYNERLSQRRAESVVRYLTEHGVEAERLTAKGYGESQPKTVSKKMAEKYPFLHENDVLTEEFILKLQPEQQEVCNSLNRRTEFRVLRTTYGLVDSQGNLVARPQ
uniref:PorE family type IX secretion system protein n=1 Tax=Alloprevotella sp. TaxID=1872471 RepID=UPI004026118C